jgi:hypothetical protein
MGVFGDVYRTVKSEVRTYGPCPIDLKQLALDQATLESMRAAEAKQAEVEKRVAAQMEQQRKWDLNNSRFFLENAKHAVYQKAAIDIPNILAAEAFSSIYIKALPHDRDYVLEKYQAFKNMGAMYMRKIGGINGLKKAAESSNSPFLKGMYRAIMEVAKEAVKRVTSDGHKCLTEEEVKEMIAPRPTDDERNKLINKIDELGSDELAELVNSKVIKVVTDERRAEQTAKQLDTVILGDIQGGDMAGGDETDDNFDIPDVREGSEEDESEEDKDEKKDKKSKKDDDDSKDDLEDLEDDEDSDKKSKKKKDKDKDDDKEDSDKDEDSDDEDESEDEDDEKTSKKKKKKKSDDDEEEDSDDSDEDEDKKDKKKKSKKDDDEFGDLSLEAYHSILSADMRKVMEAMGDDDEFDIEEYLSGSEYRDIDGFLEEGTRAQKLIHDKVNSAYATIKDKKNSALKSLGDRFGRAKKALSDTTGAAYKAAKNKKSSIVRAAMKTFESWDPVKGTLNYSNTNEPKSLFFSIMCSVTNDMIHQATEGARTLDYTKVPERLMNNPLNLSVFYQYMNENSTRPASYVSEATTEEIPSIGKKEIISEAVAQYTLLETAHTMKLIKVDRATIAEQAKFLRTDEQYMVPVKEFLGVLSNKAEELVTGRDPGHGQGSIANKVRSLIPKIEPEGVDDNATNECGLCEPDPLLGDVKVTRFADTAKIQGASEFPHQVDVGFNGFDPKRDIFGTKVAAVKAPDTTKECGANCESTRVTKNNYSVFDDVSFTRYNDVTFGKP